MSQYITPQSFWKNQTFHLTTTKLIANTKFKPNPSLNVKHLDNLY